jgi:FAD/FMN-containing dehydrogenase/Fe-S oxidoreductase
MSEIQFSELAAGIRGDLYVDEVSKILYATDASEYREMPVAITRPADKKDISAILTFCRQHGLPVIPRTAGTSLAGQVVGRGVVLDVSRYMTRILELNQQEHWIRVEPGVIPDEMNKYLESYGLFFGPETSTSNRCMLAGMLGNNSCGSHSILYGSTRDHTLEVECILSDGSEVLFGPLMKKEFMAKTRQDDLEGRIYRNIYDILSDKQIRDEIRRQYPHPDIPRRNNGYALDLLMDTDPFTGNGIPFNMSRLLAGSEGTLAVTIAIKFNLVPLPPKEKGLVCVHLARLPEAFRANLVALKHKPGAVELMDKTVLDLTKDNIEQQKNRFFIEGDPEALLLVEFARETQEEIAQIARALENDLRRAGYGYAFPVLYGDDVNKVWNLRKAGLGVLSNMKGDAKPVAVIEDTAVRVEDLPDYMDDFARLLEKYNKSAVYYAHIGSGELHLRPVLNLRDPADVELFHTLGREVALLVKTYRGSLSGEHGDGRLRGEFIPLMVGEKIYKIFKEVKKTFDPYGMLNPGKITDTPPMNRFLRKDPAFPVKEIKTYFDFSATDGYLRAVERCNGSGDCRKTEITGGVMCPSYMATRDEDKTPRARSNLLREVILHSDKEEPLDDPRLYNILDLCLSCKGCKSECPSSVDITRLKAEFLQHYYDLHGIPLRTRLIAWYSSVQKAGMIFPALYNFFLKNKILSRLIKKMIGFATQRSMPLLAPHSLRHWLRKNLKALQPQDPVGKIYLFVDEFTNYQDVEIGKKTVLLLSRLGYAVEAPAHALSGRTFLSKGLVKKAGAIARRNVKVFAPLVTDDSPLVGIEPSGILGFRDEYPDLVRGDLQEKARLLAQRALTIDEFLARETEAGRIRSGAFTRKKKHIKLHGHCYQKALSSTEYTKKILSLPENYSVEEIPSGCCGMAGSFGFEKEHYDLSMKVGELVLFPAIRKTPTETIIAAPGTSCRHQIKDGTHRQALHPVEILYEALKEA